MAHYEKQPWEDAHPWYGSFSAFTPGITACNAYTPAGMKLLPTSVRDRIGGWFIRPLENFKGEDGFVCLIVLLPIIEKFLRYRLREENEEGGLDFSKGGHLCKELGAFLAIPADDAFEFWRAFRNGLLHRATIDAALPYALHPDPHSSKPIDITDGILNVYVWPLRDRVVEVLKKEKGMWTRDRFPLPEIYYTKK